MGLQDYRMMGLQDDGLLSSNVGLSYHGSRNEYEQ